MEVVVVEVMAAEKKTDSTAFQYRLRLHYDGDVYIVYFALHSQSIVEVVHRTGVDVSLEFLRPKETIKVDKECDTLSSRIEEYYGKASQK